MSDTIHPDLLRSARLVAEQLRRMAEVCETDPSRLLGFDFEMGIDRFWYRVELANERKVTA